MGTVQNQVHFGEQTLQRPRPRMVNLGTPDILALPEFLAVTILRKTNMVTSWVARKSLPGELSPLSAVPMRLLSLHAYE